ncbi:hypothetical protein BXZ70DRAFT_252162 [Cristinia sonorae]|uniref:F-box domain-containing protein n=1 Tax=Cristinia sonorae TaxID=1940300 RepID=A0A8K0UYA5_9AGAR|nr:hypothetical protein BXZ70DRAFT_252162 [Cristinia sonorae]
MSHLPPELWLAIFRFATTTELTASLLATSYRSFDYPTNGFIDDSLKVKYAIVHVCRSWRDLASSMLYEDVLVLTEYASILRHILKGHSEDDGAGHRHRVRRLCLPYSASVPQMSTRYPTDAVSILQMCPSLEVLVRPNMAYGSRGEAQMFEYEAEPCPPLPSLKRLDWWHRNDAARTGGINCLTDVLQAAPNLTYLSLEGEVGLSLMQLHTTVTLPALTTLHVRRVNSLFMLQISKWYLPSLRHIILDGYTNVYMVQSIARSFGEQIWTMELGKSLRFYMDDAVHPILEGCPNLKELNYRLFFTRNPTPPATPHASLSTVGLHGATNLFFEHHEHELWAHLERHLEAFCSPSYPALRQILLHGDWGSILGDPRYQHSAQVQKLKERGCSVDVCHY